MTLFSLLPLTIFTVTLYITYVHASFTYVEASSDIEDDFTSCITFDSEERMIEITCQTTDLTEIDNQLRAQDVLRIDEDIDKGWKLNAGISVAEDATLYINSSDTSWLKIIGDGETAYPILVSGGLKIDSVKVTSWNPNINNYTTSQDSGRNGDDVTIGTPRPYITVEDGATGTTDIMNSEIAYLGYESGYGGGRTGLRYEAGDGSILRGNDIHHLYFGLYSRGVGGMVIEDNHIHDNIQYGLDPHTGTHDMVIRNNTIHDSGSTGVICSLDCYNITIENNNIYNNTKHGIMFSRNMFDSIARNNVISNEDDGIVISESHNNEVYNNIISDSGSGIDVDEDSYENLVYNNTIINILDPSDALHLRDGASEENILHSNTLISIDGERINLDEVELE